MSKRLIDVVSNSMIAMEFNGGHVIGFRGVDCRSKRPQVNALPVSGNLGSEGVFYSSPSENAFEPTHVISMGPVINSVLRFRNNAEIFLSAIKSVEVHVIDFKRTFGKSKNKLVKENLRVLLSATRNARLCVSVYSKAPLEAANKFRIFVVDQCRLALRQSNLNHFVIVAKGGVYGYGN